MDGIKWASVVHIPAHDIEFNTCVFHDYSIMTKPCCAMYALSTPNDALGKDGK
jgi:hypothetical protein